MDAHFFRALASALTPQLLGARLDKVFAPAPAVWTFQLSTYQGRAFLIVRLDKNDNALLLSPNKPDNPAAPPARAMWLRKRLTNRRILTVHADWPSLRLALGLSAGKGPAAEGRFLMIDLRDPLAGPQLLGELDPEFAAEPDWPALDADLADPELWRRYPQFSPALRRRLAGLPPRGAREQVASLREVWPGPFWLDAEGGAPLVWSPEGPAVPEVDDLLEAAQLAWQGLVHAGDPRAERERQRSQARASKKLRRQLDHLERDRKRLESMRDAGRLAEALQAHISRLERELGLAVPEKLRLLHPEGEELEIALNTHLSLSENMQALFARAAKGRRGLAAVAQREALLLAEQREQQERQTSEMPFSPAGTDAAAPQAGAPGSAIPARYRGLPVHVYRTDDGFLALRGKSAKANQQLLTKLASSHDYWLHARGVPGAHVIVKRDHPGQEVPERSLRQAAVLAALASPFKDAGRAEVILAQVRHVRTMKGAPQGLVRVDVEERGLSVEVDPELETLLRLS